MIKNKYELKTNPTVINFEINPSSLWAIYDNNIEENNGSNVIFLNYQKNFRVNFKRSYDMFEMQNYYQNTGEISKLIFHTVNNSVTLNNDVTIFKVGENREKIIIYKNKILGNFDEKKGINIDFKTSKLNSRRFPIFIKIENLEKNILNNISSIELILKNSYSIDNYKIIEKQNNCYYVTD